MRVLRCLVYLGRGGKGTTSRTLGVFKRGGAVAIGERATGREIVDSGADLLAIKKRSQ